MELWIRSQDREYFNTANNISVIDNRVVMIANQGRMTLGTYATKERALEILDEIQNKLQNKFLCRPTCTLRAKDIERIENLLNLKYKHEAFIMQPSAIDIVPINCDIVVYEMPKE